MKQATTSRVVVIVVLTTLSFVASTSNAQIASSSLAKSHHPGLVQQDRLWCPLTSPSSFPPPIAKLSSFPARSTHSGAPIDFGASLALSATGHVLVVGAPHFDNSSNNDNAVGQTNHSSIPNNAGAVFFYQRFCKDCAENQQDVQDTVGAHETSSFQWKLVGALYGEQENEELGHAVTLSPDGSLMAVRKGSNDDYRVQVYSIVWPTLDLSSSLSSTTGGDESATLYPLADSVGRCSDGGTNVELTSQNYLVVSCEGYNMNTGQVEVFRLSVTDNGQDLVWTSIAVVKGESTNSNFGWKTAVVDHTYKPGIIRMAVSAPAFQQERGMVRVVDIAVEETGIYDDTVLGTVRRVGQDLLGLVPGEQFGFSLAMSQTTEPILAVGVPQATDDSTNTTASKQGVVRVWSYRSELVRDVDTGLLVPLAPPAWIQVTTLVGLQGNNGDEFGRAIDMTKDGDRIVASSSQHDGGRGMFALYERINSFGEYALLSSVFGSDRHGQFGYDVKFNAAGSIVAAGSVRSKNGSGLPVGSVSLYLDESPFCGLPAHQQSFLKVFGDRFVCRNGYERITSKTNCSRAIGFEGGHFVDCQWHAFPVDITFGEDATDTHAPETPDDETKQPTVSPTMMATDPIEQTTTTPIEQTTTTTAFPSPAPTDVTSNTKGGRSVVLNGCRCDGMGKCLTTTLAQDEELNVCIYASQDEDLTLVDVVQLFLQQGDNNRDVLIDDAEGIRGQDIATTCTQRICQVRTPKLDPTFFQNEKTLIAAGAAEVVFPVNGGLRRLVTDEARYRGSFVFEISLDRQGHVLGVDQEVGGTSSFVDISILLWVTAFLFVLVVILACSVAVSSVKQGATTSVLNATKQENDARSDDLAV